MSRRAFCMGLGAVALTQCRPPPPLREPLTLLRGPWLSQWSPPAVQGAGKVTAEDNLLRLESGAPMTVVRFGALADTGFPLDDYEVRYEARRVEGSDFFAALTFPVGSMERCLSFINGGWGGGTTGLSNIDHTPASDNLTASLQRYVLGQWVAFVVSVSAQEVTVSMDGRLIIRTAVQGHHFGLRPGDIEACAPFGFASYETVGEVRNVLLGARAAA